MDVLAAAAAALPPSDEPPEPAYRRLTQLERWSIIVLHNDSRSERYIAKHLRVSRDSVRKWLMHHEQFGNVRWSHSPRRAKSNANCSWAHPSAPLTGACRRQDSSAVSHDTSDATHQRRSDNASPSRTDTAAGRAKSGTVCSSRTRNASTARDSSVAPGCAVRRAKHSTLNIACIKRLTLSR